MTTETPTLNNAQRDGIRALRETAYRFAAECDAEMDLICADGHHTDVQVATLLRRMKIVGEPTREDLLGVIVWVDREWEKGRRPEEASRLLDDATALLRWVDGAL